MHGVDLIWFPDSQSSTPSFQSLSIMNTHEKFVASHTVGSLLAELKQQLPELIDLSVESTVEEAFDTLLANDVTSVPVYRIQDETKEYIAIVNSLDLLRFTTIDPAIGDLKTQSQSLEDLLSLHDRSQFLLRPVKNAIGLTPESAQLFIVHPSDPLVDLLHLFTTRRVHRVLVIDDGVQTPRQTISRQSAESSGLTSTRPISYPVLLSQTDVLRFLWLHNHRLGKILDSLVGDLAKRPVTTVTIHETALQAFSHISSSNFHAVAVVDDVGQFVEEISAADLRGLNRDRVSDLLRPVMMFLSNTQGKLVRPLTCHAKFTLSQCISGLMKGEAHRMWMTDGEERVVGVITLSDVLSAFLPIIEE